jgi:TM2 domain-containing membrane protein YozV
MSKITFRCVCGKLYQVDASLAGRSAHCKHCGQRVQIPGATPPLPVATPLSAAGPGHAAQNMVYCHACGGRIPATAQFCNHCGARQSVVSEPRMPMPTSEPSRVTACLLAIFLGSLGAHKFYLGERNLEIIYIVISIIGIFLCFISNIILHLICIVEGLAYLSCTDEAFAIRYGTRPVP